MGVAAAEPRVPTSLRIPTRIMEVVSTYAETHGLSKTDAFLHFVELGMEHQRSTDEAPQLSSISERLDRVLAILDGTPADNESTADEDRIPNDKIAVVDEDGALERGKAMRAVASAAQQFSSIRRAYLFGSFARGDFTDRSGIDVRIELDPTGHFGLGDVDHFAKAIERETGRSVDVITARSIKNPALSQAFERDRVLAYERQA